MSKIAVEHVFTGTTTPYTAYDSTKTNLGKLIIQNTGTTPDGSDKWAGPIVPAILRISETATTAVSVSGFPHAISWSSTYDLVFTCTNTAAATTQRIYMATYNKLTGAFVSHGTILFNRVNITNITIRSCKAFLYRYTTGTVAVTGTAVTGSSTAWQTARYAVGSRIGFGSTDPAAITNWYEISAIGSDTSITLTGSAGSIAGGTSFVIEELRFALVITNSTVANGGLYLIKGLHPGLFTVDGISIPAAVSTDNVRAVYLLNGGGSDPTVGAGLAYEEPASNTQHDVYFLNSESGVRFYKFNIRAALTVASGVSSSAFAFRTASVAITGTLSQEESAIFANTAGQTTGNGVDTVFFVTTTRFYSTPTSGITNGGSPTLTSMNELPPGTTTTFSLNNALTNLCYDADYQRFVVMPSAQRRLFMTKFGDSVFSNIFLVPTLEFDTTSANFSVVVFHPKSATFSYNMAGWSLGGIFYFVTNQSSGLHYLNAMPLGAHWDFGAGIDAARQNRLITPKMPTTGVFKFHRAYVTNVENVGPEEWGTGIGPEPFRVYARTSGIDDNSGGWTLLAGNLDISALTPGTHIQFAIEFRVAGLTCLPARIYSVAAVYEDGNTDSHFQPSVNHSDLTNERFAWKFVIPFQDTVPTLRVRLYDTADESQILDDNTASPTGTFEKSTDDGQNWVAWNTTDKTNDTTYIRYTPASLTNGLRVRAWLSLN